MPRRFLLTSFVLFAIPSLVSASDATIERAQSVLQEIMAIPARRIPADLLRDAHGVAIIPGVIKIGFIAGVRRGHGVILTKDRDGDWTLPQFVTLTGGSAGWQVGAQSTDVILVFRTASSIENIRRGQFTIGADAAAAAGPVGRNASAATDAQLRAEILSYSRSRGLFAGVSLDGSVLEINRNANRSFYGDVNQHPAPPVPPSAVRLLEAVANLAGSGTTPATATPPASDANRIRRELAQASASLNAVLPADWQKFLALPADVFTQGEAPPLPALQAARANFDRVTTDPAFAALKARPEFQLANELLTDYIAALGRPAVIALPPAPGG